MKKSSEEENALDDYLGCIGEFSPHDSICRNHCALNLRCAIECSNGTQFDLLDELIIETGMFLKIQ